MMSFAIGLRQSVGCQVPEWSSTCAQRSPTSAQPTSTSARATWRVAGVLCALMVFQVWFPVLAAADDGKTTGKETSAKKPRNEFLDTESDDTETDPAKLVKRTLENMRSAENRIRKRDSGEQTQQLQTTVIADLDRLIKLAESQQAFQQTPQPNGPLSSKQRPPDQPNPQTTEQPNPKKSPRRKESDPSQESTTNTETAKKKTEISVATQERLVVQQVWGNLPPKVQSELKSMAGEKYLRQYEKLIIRYYQSLAERHRRR